jgi:hypothetical protein
VEGCARELAEQRTNRHDLDRRMCELTQRNEVAFVICRVPTVDNGKPGIG